MRINSRRHLVLVFASSTPIWVSAFFVGSSRQYQSPATSYSGYLNTLFTAQALSSSHTSSMKMSSNPFSSIIGDVASSLFGGNTVVAPNNQVDQALTKITTSTWTEIRENLTSKQTPDEQEFRQNLEKGYGIASPLHKIRLYDQSNTEKDIQVTFYRDSASWCPYCQKVWLALETKQIPYRVEKINMRCYGDKPRSFIQIQPGGQIPVAEINGKIYGQSNDILMALETTEFLKSNSKSLLPPPELQGQAQQLYTLERQLFSVWMSWLTGRFGSERAKQEFIDTLKYVDSVLQKADGPYFLGKEFTLVDVQFASFLERMVASLLYFKGFMIRVPPDQRTEAEYPGINAWFDAMEELPAYQLTKSDYYTHAWDLPPQLGGCTSEPDGKPYEDAINGIRSLDGTKGSWELPLQPDNGGVEPDWSWAGDESAARREAVERVSGNHEAIVRFACRGAGQKGMPVMAPLSDPNAVPNEAVQKSVDQCLRTVCSAILNGDVKKYEDEMKSIADTISSKGGKEFVDAVMASLAYMRDRVGVPRDMKLPAARQLRAHLNWAIGILLDKSGI